MNNIKRQNLDFTFCASPNCKNKCGRKMNEETKKYLCDKPWMRVYFGYFCD